MLTNLLNLPEPILRAAERDAYSKGDADYSVTELIKPARMAALQRLYADTIVEDVADNIWSLLGRLGHSMLEAAGAPETGAILEERLYATVLGKRISGQMDHTILRPTGVLDDYKFVSVWAVLDGIKPEWEAQLNLYAWLRSLAGQTVTALRVIAMLRDWSIAKARTESEKGRYPKRQVAAIDVPLWPLDKVVAFVEERVWAHSQADEWATHPESFGAREPLCSDEERWVRPVKWALMKGENKRATKLYDQRQDAEMSAQAAKGFRVERRGGEPIRCIDYCSVGRAGLCGQWNAEKVLLSTSELVDTSAFD